MTQQHTPISQGAVQFDGHGMTTNCPLNYAHETQYVLCMQCKYHIQSMGFTVICRKQIEMNEIRNKA